jgi:hypothetical protein
VAIRTLSLPGDSLPVPVFPEPALAMPWATRDGDPKGDGRGDIVGSSAGDPAAENTGELEMRGGKRLLSPEACRILLPATSDDLLFPYPRSVSADETGLGVGDASVPPGVALSPARNAPDEVRGRSLAAADSADKIAREPGLDSPEAVLGGGMSVSWQSSMTERRRDWGRDSVP